MTTPASTSAPTPPSAAAAPAPAVPITPTPIVPAPAPAVAVATTPTVALPPAGKITDKTSPEIVHKIEYTPEQALAFLAAIDPAAPAGKGVRILAAHVGPKGELDFTLYYKA